MKIKPTRKVRRNVEASADPKKEKELDGGGTGTSSGGTRRDRRRTGATDHRSNWRSTLQVFRSTDRLHPAARGGREGGRGERREGWRLKGERDR